MFIQKDLDHASWRFIRKDLAPEKAASSDLNDVTWEKISLPHCAHIEPAICNDQWEGICWYRLPIMVEKEWGEKIIYLEFDGVMQKSEFYINGKYYFTHEGGYQRFTVPLTNMLNAGKENLIAIRVDNRPSCNCPPGQPLRSLDFCYYSGIYRSARLTVKEKIHISDPLEVNIEAGGGIFLQTMEATEEAAKIRCSTHVMHSVIYGEVWNLPQKADTEVPCTLEIQMLNADKIPVMNKIVMTESIRPNMDHTFCTEFELRNPSLWSPDTPYLYTVRFTLIHEGKVLETQEVRYGIRVIAFTRKDGWLINGKKTPILGTNHHQDFPMIGNAAPATMQRRDAMIIKKAGYNLVRLAHYPQSPAFLDACDELGICVMAPIAGWQFASYNSTFINNVLRDCRELIRNERNRPCVALWEVSLNETYPNAWLQEEMHRIAHREYPGKHCYTCGDVYGLYEGWDVLFNRTKLNNREKPVIVREYGDWAFGGGKSTSRRTRKDGEFDLLRQAWNYQWSLNRMPTEDGYIGGCTWCMFDYNNGFRELLCECGDGDNFRYPKYKYFFYMSQGAKDPMVYLATRREWKEKTIVFSNCEEVEIFLNGKSVAKQKPDGGENTSYHTTGNPNWETVLRPWELDGLTVEIFNGGNCENLAHPPFTFMGLPREDGELKAVGYVNGKAVAEHIVRTAEKPATLKIEVREDGVPVTDDDIVFVDVFLTDRNGTIVSNNDLKVTLEASGNAFVIGETKRQMEAGIVSFVLKVMKKEGFALKAKGGRFTAPEWIK